MDVSIINSGRLDAYTSLRFSSSKQIGSISPRRESRQVGGFEVEVEWNLCAIVTGWGSSRSELSRQCQPAKRCIKSRIIIGRTAGTCRSYGWMEGGGGVGFRQWDLPVYYCNGIITLILDTSYRITQASTIVPKSLAGRSSPWLLRPWQSAQRW